MFDDYYNVNLKLSTIFAENELCINSINVHIKPSNCHDYVLKSLKYHCVMISEICK